ncbi:MAG: BACON domain-containing protein [Bacteroidales bacterium]|nr:BACON domain-containing protein [Bacteroidales bacterium]
MKRNKLLFSALLCGLALLLTAGCEDFSYPGARPGNYTTVANKTLSVELSGIDTLRMTAAGGDTTFNVRSNSFWSMKGLAKVTDEETGAVSEETISWINAPVKVFEGDGTIRVTVAPNMGKKPRQADILFYTADTNVVQRLPVVQANDPSLIKPIELTFDFTDNSIMNWPTAKSTGEYFYPLNGVEYSFLLGVSNIGKYLVIASAGSYLATPIIEDYKLTRLTVHVSNNNKSARHGQVTADPAGTIIVGDYQQWPNKPSVDVVYDLHDTEYNARYYLYCVKGGLPVAGVTLKYEP